MRAALMIRETAPAVETKRCANCREWKEPTAFYRDRSATDELTSSCRSCIRSKEQTRRAAKRYNPYAPKPCRRCGGVKSYWKFQLNRPMADGTPTRAASCRECVGLLTATRKAIRRYVRRSSTQKQCTGCGLWKARSEYGKQEATVDGLRPYCHDCRYEREHAHKPWLSESEQERHRQRRERNKQRNKEKEIDPETTKRCSACGKTKTADEFWSAVDKADGLHSSCIECGRARQRKYRRDNVELLRQRKAREYRANRNRYRRAHRRWRAENPERDRALSKQWRERNRERYNASNRARKRRNPDEGVRDSHRRRARLAQAVGEYTVEQWKAICEFYDHTCLCCGWRGKMTVDHVQPISKGGKNDPTNLQPLCKSCNSRKHATFKDYRPLVGHIELLDQMRAEGIWRG